jgi:hypothetical protein
MGPSHRDALNSRGYRTRIIFAYDNFHDQFWRKFLHTVCSPTVLRTLVQNLLFGLTASFKVAVHAYFPATTFAMLHLQMLCLCERMLKRVFTPTSAVPSFW